MAFTVTPVSLAASPILTLAPLTASAARRTAWGSLATVIVSRRGNIYAQATAVLQTSAVVNSIRTGAEQGGGEEAAREADHREERRDRCCPPHVARLVHLHQRGADDVVAVNSAGADAGLSHVHALAVRA